MEPYRQLIREIDLAIERGTTRVPGDGYFYVLHRGEVQGRYKTLKKAQVQYRQIIEGENWHPEPQGVVVIDPSKEAVERYLEALEDYWGAAHNHRHRGGKTMYRS